MQDSPDSHGTPVPGTARRRGPSISLHTLLLTILCTCATIATPALARAGNTNGASYRFDITGQTLPQALRNYAQVSGQEIIFTEDLFQGAKPVSLKGDYTAEDALEKLLKGTGLKYQRSPTGAIMILRSGDATTNATHLKTLSTSEKREAAQREGEDYAPGMGASSDTSSGQKRSSWTRLARNEDQNSPERTPSRPGCDSPSSRRDPFCSDGSTIEEVVVTAQKREEKLQDVPMAISAISAASLRSLGAVDFAGYARTVPGLSFTDLGNGRQRVALRGLNASAGAATVSYYIGETPIPAGPGNTFGRVQANPHLVDIDRVEVLRGPQGTLYGSSSMGGTIRLIPTPPDLDRFGGWVEVGGTAASGNSWGSNYTAVLNAPIVPDTLGARVALWYRDDDGFIDRRWGPNSLNSPTQFQGTEWNIGGQIHKGGRVSLLFAPSDALEITGLVYHDETRGNGVQDYTAGAINPEETLDQIMLANVPEFTGMRFTLSNLTAKLALGDMKLTSSSSYYRSRFLADEEGTAIVQRLFGVLFPNKFTERTPDSSFTQELRLATEEPIHGFSAIAGGYYNRDSSTLVDLYPVPGWNAEFAPAGPTDPSGLYAQDDSLYYFQVRNTVEEISEFGELSYAITNKLKVTGGVRHYDIDTSTIGYQSGLFAGNTRTDRNWPGHFTGTLYKGNISFQPTDRQLIYATYSEGFRRGFGVNTHFPPACDASQAIAQVNPDGVKNYEIGVKTQWLDKLFAVNLGVYRIDWSDIQQNLLLSCGFNFIANAGRAVSQGAELEIPAQLTDHIGAGISASYTKATLSNDAPAFKALAGDQILNVPLWQAAAYSDYSFAVTDSIQAVARVDVQYTGSSYNSYKRLPGTQERDPAFQVDDVTLLNARIQFTKGDLSAAFFVNNLLDEIYRQGVQISHIADVPGRPRYVANRPRTFGISVRKQF